MSMVRMFHITCDNTKAMHHTDDPGDQWYAKMAKIYARSEGWHLASGDRAICPQCWESGIRFKDLID